MTLLDELHPASYKGVAFLMMSSSIAGGRKNVRHSFPNSNKQTIEDLGLAPKVFTVNAVVSGDTYIQDRDRFIAALEDSTPGVFVHPWHGQLNNYIARTYTLIENLTTLGEAQFNIVFEISNIEGVPIKAQNTLSIIEQANNATVSAVSSNFVDTYNITPGFIGNFTDGVGKVNDFVNALDKNTSIVSASADEINAFNQSVRVLQADVNSLVQKPQELMDSIANLFTTMDSLYVDPNDTVAVMGEFFNFGDTDVEIAPKTSGLSERLNNRNVMNQAIQTIGLGYSYFNTAQTTFETVEQIEVSADELEVQYQKIILGSGLTDETKSVLTDMRTAMQEFFEEQRLNASQIINVDTSLTSSRLLAHQYYADSTRATQLIELNRFDDVAFIEGNIKVLTE